MGRPDYQKHIEERIAALSEGSAFITSDFLDIADTQVVNKALSRMVEKGGTSLSKCFGLIQRFSEDIDLILDWRLLGYEKDEPWAERSKTQQDKFNKSANVRTEEFLRETFLPQLQADFEKLLGDEFSLCIEEDDP